jgi:S-formylglutathione hydrolase FrmB
MKTLLVAFLVLLVSDTLINATPVTNINAIFRFGQVFVTWDNTADEIFIMYRSTTPITRGNQLMAAQNLGRVSTTSSYNTHSQRPLRIDSASVPLASTKGLFVATSTAIGSYYYAVTTKTGSIEDTAIIAGSNSLSTPVGESVSDPRPVWQFDTLIAPKMFNVYVWFATNVTSVSFPKMTNAGTYPLNFAVVKQGTQSPHPVTFWLRGSAINFFVSYVYGTGDPNEYIISIDDFIPNGADGNLTYYYGYHENYDLYSNTTNPIPTTGTIYNYSAAMVNHTVNWAFKSLPVDTTRTYMTGWSMGGIGSLLNSLVMPSKFAAIFVFVPVFDMAAGVPTNPAINSVINRLWGTYQTNLFTSESMSRNERLNTNHLLSINKHNSLPIIYSFCGKSDQTVGWPEKIVFYDSINVLKHGGFHFWSMGNHQQTIYSNPWQIAVLPPSISFFTRYRTNLSYPAFSNCSHNNNPGNGSPANGDSMGTINGYLEWNDDIVDSTYKWEITLKTKNLVTIYDTLYAPDSCDADVTLRRLQRFNPAVGSRIEWTNTKNNAVVQQGAFTYTGGLISISDLKFYKSSNRLRMVNIPIGISNNGNNIPIRYVLYQNYPNPFNPQTGIRFDLPEESLAKLVIYDVLGREIAVLVNETLRAGEYRTEWEAKELPSGVYFYRLSSSDFVGVKKMILMK